MKQVNQMQRLMSRWRNPLSLGAVFAVLVSFALLPAADGMAQETSKTDKPEGKQPPAESAAKKAPAVPLKLTGAELYSMHCNRCHPERYPTERTAAQWKTILLHMRVRANLPAEQARTILKYLQENSGR